MVLIFVKSQTARTYEDIVEKFKDTAGEQQGKLQAHAFISETVAAKPGSDAQGKRPKRSFSERLTCVKFVPWPQVR